MASFFYIFKEDHSESISCQMVYSCYRISHPIRYSKNYLKKEGEGAKQFFRKYTNFDMKALRTGLGQELLSFSVEANYNTSTLLLSVKKMQNAHDETVNGK